MDNKRRKWTVKRQETRFDSPWISVREYDVVAPTGTDANYGVVHFKNLAVGVLPIDADGCTFLIGQERFPSGQYSWELPEGGGKIDVPTLETAKRELSEEAGLKADNWLELFAEVQLSNSVTDERAFAYIAWGLSTDNTFERDAWEDLEVRKVPFKKAVEMARVGEIFDAFSLVMLFKASHLVEMGELPEDVCALLKG